ncbi:GNAT family N-acetyltransferase, partial [Parafrankia colletiae]|uniref:GNAT family N-acetyltransferase n=1 Tax=Parafrankia colletiae TaxID=573497 RepID=UPI0010423B8D
MPVPGCTHESGRGPDPATRLNPAPHIAEFHGTPVAYLEIYRTTKDQIAGTYDADAHDIGMHAAIAVTSMVNKGVGPRLLPQLIRSVFELDPRCRRIVFEPDCRNTVMRR